MHICISRTSGVLTFLNYVINLISEINIISFTLWLKFPHSHAAWRTFLIAHTTTYADLIREFCLTRGHVWKPFFFFFFPLIHLSVPILKNPAGTELLDVLYDETFLKWQSWNHVILVDCIISPMLPTDHVFKTILPSFFTLWFSEVWMLLSVMKQGTIMQP